MDKAYPTLDDKVRQQLVLQRYLSQLDNEQIAFSVKQRKPTTIEAAVEATLECESYLVRSTHQSRAVVAPVQAESKDSALMEMMTQLMTRMDRLEENSKGAYLKKRTTQQPLEQEAKPWMVVCYQCGQEGRFARGCGQPKRSSNQGN